MITIDQEFISRDEVRSPDDSVLVASQQQPMRELTPALIEAAHFPTLYINAQQALQACADVDEVKEIDDKWTAIAMYAKQSKHKELENLARRIGVRSERRLGELLNEMRDEGKTGTGPFSAAAKREHGLSKDVVSRALILARAPEEELEALLGSDDVPSKTTVAKQFMGHPGPVGYNGPIDPNATTLNPRAPSKALQKRSTLEHRQAVFGSLRDFYQFWDAYDNNDTQRAFSLPEARSAAITLVKRIETRLANFRENPQAHNSALNLIDSIETELKQYQTRPINVKTPEGLIDVIEARVRKFSKALASIK